MTQVEAKGNFAEGLQRALEIASFSPSSHNSQPWEILVVTGEQRRSMLREWLRTRAAACISSESEAAWLIVALNRERCLRALPAFKLEMNLSCGAYVESLLLGLWVQGLRASVAWVNSGTIGRPPVKEDWPDAWHPLVIVEVGRYCQPVSDELKTEVAALPRRITNRGPYAGKTISQECVRTLINAGSRVFPESGSALKVSLIRDRRSLKRLGAFIAETAGVEFENGQVWQETYRYLRFGGDKGEGTVTGLPVQQLFGPMPACLRWVLKWVLAPASMRWLKYAGLPGLLSSRLGSLVAAGPMFVLLAFKDDQPDLALQLAAGGCLLGVWIAATRAGLALHPVSVILQHPQLRSRFQKEFNFAGRVFFVARAGVPLREFPPAPKRPVTLSRILTV